MQVSVSFTGRLTDYKVTNKFVHKEFNNPKKNQNTYLKATECVARIADPLWKKVCNDLIYNMGPAFVFKIHESSLGNISPQDHVLYVTCTNKNAADFIEQYDFVILDSLQPYFPALRQVRAEIAEELMH
jgi:hypothetical protein